MTCGVKAQICHSSGMLYFLCHWVCSECHSVLCINLSCVGPHRSPVEALGVLVDTVMTFPAGGEEAWTVAVGELLLVLLI